MYAKPQHMKYAKFLRVPLKIVKILKVKVYFLTGSTAVKFSKQYFRFSTTSKKVLKRVNFLYDLNPKIVKMTRHGKNCTAGAVYTYHERKKDAEQSGFGSKNVRLGKDSVKDFDCCCLTLQPCREPVITPDGYLYDKEAILESLLHQKKEMARQTKAFEKAKRREEQEKRELKVAMERSKVESFEKLEKRLTTKPHNAFNSGEKSEQSSSSSADSTKGE